MREPYLLVISNKLEKTNLKRDLKVKFVRWDWPLKELWAFFNYHVVIIDFSFNNDDELQKINPEIYESLKGGLLEVIEGLIVIVICGYPNKEFKMSVSHPNPDESRYPGSQYQTYYDYHDEDFEEVVIEKRDSYTFLQGLPIEIYDRLIPEPPREYDKKIKSPFKKYFNFADIALSIQYLPPLSSVSIKPISKIGGVGKNRYCVAASFRIEKGILILLPGYNKLKKNKVFLSLIKIGKRLYREQQKLKEKEE